MKIARPKAVLLTLYFMASCLIGQAQINESDTAKFQLRVSLTGTYQKGNVEVTAIRSKIDFSYSPVREFVFKSHNSSLYQAFYSKKVDNDIFSRNFFYYKPKNTIYPFGIAYVSANYRRKIDLRYFAGAGVTYQLLHKPLHVLKLSASAVYEKTDFAENTYNYSEYNGSDKIKLWRGTLYLGGWSYVVEKRLRILYDAYWQPSFVKLNNYRTQFDIGMELPFWKGLAFNVVYTYTHENVVIYQIKQKDRLLTFGLSYNFKTKHG